MTALLEIIDLKIYFDVQEGTVKAVDGIRFDLQEGGTLGLVGESGCGKSVTARSIMRLIPMPPGRLVSGRVLFRGDNLLRFSENDMRKIRGDTISMIFQEPMTSLNPVYTIGNQIAEAIKLHQKVGRREARGRTISLLEQVGIPDPERRLYEFPHQFSGGMRQRVMIAMAISCRPAILIADEPTTALDVTTQAQILKLMRQLQSELGTAILFIAHDLAIIAEMADHVGVMYAGKIVEYAETKSLFSMPAHPYTAGLLASTPHPYVVKDKLNVIEGIVPDLIDLPRGCRFEPRCSRKLPVCCERDPEPIEIASGRWVLCFNPLGRRYARTSSVPQIKIPKRNALEPTVYPDKEVVNFDSRPVGTGEVIVEISNLVKHFPLRSSLFGRNRGVVKALNCLKFNIMRGETLGVVGESGCGKTTLGRLILGLIEPTAGCARFEGNDIFSLDNDSRRKLRKKMQIVFQDPFGSLNPRMRIEEIVAHGLRIHKIGTSQEQHERTLHLLETVGLKSDAAQRYPHEFSGGQRQRIAIARALAVNPSFIVADEPVSALDVSTQAQILNLMKDLRDQFGLTYLFVSHNLSVTKHISDRIAVLYLGKLVEMAQRDDIYDAPLHPYTIALLSAVPVPDPEIDVKRVILEGEMPSPVNPPTGCYFRTRCTHASQICKEDEPPLLEVKSGHWVACHKV